MKENQFPGNNEFDMIFLSEADGLEETENSAERPAKQKRAPGAPETSSKPRKKKSAKPAGASSKKRSGSGVSASGKKKHTSAQTSHKKKRGSHKKKKPDQTLFLHLAFVAFILLIAIVGIVKLVKWNRGRESGYDPNEVTTEFDTEPEDYFVPLDSATAALQKDDSVTSILLLGNGSLAKDKGEDASVGKRLEALTGGVVYDASLDHTFLSVKNAAYDPDYPTDVFSLYWMSYCISSGDFTLLEDTAHTWEGDDTVSETVEMLKGLDMDAIDVIAIMYDYHDYESERILAGPYDETLPATCCGCLLQSIRLLQQAYPHIRIIVSSPYFNYVKDQNDEPQPAGTLDFGQGTLADYMIAYKNIAVNCNVSFIDNYFGTITADNYEQYLQDDKEHLNDKGKAAVAERIFNFIGVSE